MSVSPIDQWQSIFRVKLDPVLFKVEILLAAIRAVKRARRDSQAWIGDPGRDGLATRLTLHTMMSSHDECFGASKLLFSPESVGSTS